MILDATQRNNFGAERLALRTDTGIGGSLRLAVQQGLPVPRRPYQMDVHLRVRCSHRYQSAKADFGHSVARDFIRRAYVRIAFTSAKICSSVKPISSTLLEEHVAWQVPQPWQRPGFTSAITLIRLPWRSRTSLRPIAV